MILLGDCLEILKTLDEQSVDCVVTSPPYWGLRDYGHAGQIGLEKSMNEFIEKMVNVFDQVKRVLKDSGTLWLNLGDSYAGGMSRGASSYGNKQQSNIGSTCAKGKGPKVPDGLKPKDICGIPWRVAFALQSQGWYLRQDIVWSKPNPMPESVKDRCTKAHEYIFLLTKKEKYFFDQKSIMEPMKVGMNESFFGSKRHLSLHPNTGKGIRKGQTKERSATPLTAMRGDRTNSGGFTPNAEMTRNKRSVWTVSTKPFKGGHFATFPPNLIKPCILAGCPKDGVVLDPFAGAGTTGLVAHKYGRKFIGIELNPEYAEIAEKRISNIQQELAL